MSSFSKLQFLLNCQRSADALQVRRSGEAITWGRWRHRVGQWRAVLEREKGETWALYHPDAFEFSAILFALWATGKVACVPGSNRPLIVAQLGERVSGFIGDFDPPDSESRQLPPPAEDAAAVDTPLKLDRDARVMEIFTSGSSGEPQAIGKRLYQLAEEVNNLESMWGDLVQRAVVAGTVSHHHIYGLLFRVLWPLAAGRCFVSDTVDYLEALNVHPAEADTLVLVSSPSHLTRIPEETDWAGLRNRCRAIFSSGAPLPKEGSLAARRLLGFPPIEVFGSSETGGIAWRQQAPHGEVPWRLVNGVTATVDEDSGCLNIRSPYLAPMSGNEWYATRDRAEMLDGERFWLQGRADRIAKVEGKRVSLAEMEKRLLDHPWVNAARVLVRSGKRTEVAAAVVLTQAGARALMDQGRRALNQSLSAHLSQQFERPVLPRRWRYPAELPVDSQGKVTQENLQNLFAHTRQGRPLLPEILRVRREADVVRLRLGIPPDLFYFQGHFPVAPILPGVVQVQWADHYGRELLEFGGHFSHLEAVKFQYVVRPEQTVDLELRFDPARNKLSFRYHSDAGQHASGRIVCKQETADDG